MNAGIERITDTGALTRLLTVSSLVAVTICLLSVCMSADSDAASMTYEQDGVSYMFNENGDLVLFDVLDHSITELVIPSNIDTGESTPVKEIVMSAFYHCTDLVSVTIPSTVDLVPAGTFTSCTSICDINVSGEGGTYRSENGVLYSGGTLVAYPVNRPPTSFTIGSDVTVIGSYAFSGARNLQNVVLHDGVSAIRSNAFSDCAALTQITLPSSLDTVEHYAFANSGITSVVVPDSVTQCGSYAFMDCASLVSVTVGNGVLTVNESTFKGCGLLAQLVLGDNVSTISKNAFQGCIALTSLMLPSDLVEIGQEAFIGCSLLGTVAFPNSLKTIGDNAFERCLVLDDVVLPTGFEELGSNAFIQCSSLTNITFPAGILVHSNTFSDCVKLTTLRINSDGDSIFIDKQAFRGCPDAIHFESAREGYALKVYNYDMTYELKGDDLKDYDTWAKLAWSPIPDPEGDDPSVDGSSFNGTPIVILVVCIIVLIGGAVYIVHRGKR